MDNIFVLINNQKYGPYSKEEIINFIKEGRLNPETLCWYEGLSGWIPLKTAFPEFFAHTPPVPPSPLSQGMTNYQHAQEQTSKSSGKGCCLGCAIIFVIFLILFAIAGFLSWKYGKTYIKEYRYRYHYQFNTSMSFENKSLKNHFPQENNG